MRARGLGVCRNLQCIAIGMAAEVERFVHLAKPERDLRAVE